MSYVTTTVASPVGRLTLVASERGLAAVLWENDDPGRVRLVPRNDDPANPVLVETARQLGAYFAGRLERFDLPLDFHGTSFQRSVWEALLTIPYGETRSYGDIARQVGRPTAFRAVGAANGRNPISIIAPCHRVIGSSGDLTGFAGGLAAKRLLLGIEGHAAEAQSAFAFGDAAAARGRRDDATRQHNQSGYAVASLPEASPNLTSQTVLMQGVVP